MPIWQMVIIDIALTGICLCVFALFHHVLPQHSDNEGKVVARADSGTFLLPDSDKESETDEKSSSKGKGTASKSKGHSYTGNTGTTDIKADDSDEVQVSDADRYTEVIGTYEDDNKSVTITEVQLGAGDDIITYYMADIYVTGVKHIETAFASGEYGKNIRDDVDDMASENNAVLAISGDFYGNSESGVVIRNGVLYRTKVNDADICVLYTDGTMQTYSPEEFDADKVIASGAWQAWTFGPALLDGSGNVLSTFNSTSYLNSKNPRGAIGYVDKGHYVLVVVDGRKEGHSTGTTLTELAQIMSDMGCKTAYNLDGGKSAIMVYNDEVINKPSDGGRTISDIIYIGKE